jgi:hypothetical protein
MRVLVILWRKPIFKDMFFLEREGGLVIGLREREREREGSFFTRTRRKETRFLVILELRYIKYFTIFLKTVLFH